MWRIRLIEIIVAYHSNHEYGSSFHGNDIATQNTVFPFTKYSIHLIYFFSLSCSLINESVGKITYLSFPPPLGRGKLAFAKAGSGNSKEYTGFLVKRGMTKCVTNVCLLMNSLLKNG